MAAEVPRPWDEHGWDAFCARAIHKAGDDQHVSLNVPMPYSERALVTVPAVALRTLIAQERALGTRVAALEAERDELQQTFDLRWTADQRAIKRWQAEKPGRDLTWPDHADMVVWLLERVDAARAQAMEEAAALADTFGCGLCGMDGQAAAAIRALAVSGAPEGTNNG